VPSQLARKGRKRSWLGAIVATLLSLAGFAYSPMRASNLQLQRPTNSPMT